MLMLVSRAVAPATCIAQPTAASAHSLRLGSGGLSRRSSVGGCGRGTRHLRACPHGLLRHRRHHWQADKEGLLIEDRKRDLLPLLPVRANFAATMEKGVEPELRIDAEPRLQSRHLGLLRDVGAAPAEEGVQAAPAARGAGAGQHRYKAAQGGAVGWPGLLDVECLLHPARAVASLGPEAERKKSEQQTAPQVAPALAHRVLKLAREGERDQRFLLQPLVRCRPDPEREPRDGDDQRKRQEPVLEQIDQSEHKPRAVGTTSSFITENIIAKEFYNDKCVFRVFQFICASFSFGWRM